MGFGGADVAGTEHEPTHPGFSTSETARILGLSVTRLRSWIRSGLINPRRGARRRFSFSFQDLVVLRASKGLIEEQIPTVKVRRILHALRRQLPPGKALAGLSVYVDGDRVVVWDGNARWQPDSGQFLLNFEAASLLRKTSRRPAMPLPRRGLRLTAPQWYDLAAELEATSPDEALAAYSQAIALDPTLGSAHVNLGQLVHARGEFREAELHYREALAIDPDDAVAAFNLGVVLEDMRRPTDAERAYQQALEADPNFADAHYNLALLCEGRGRQRDALRHLSTYKRLTRRPGPRRDH
jgi:tetratricopeptide (TPR) repeat protein